MALYNFERLTIFLVEDSTYIRNVLADLLRNMGFHRIPTGDNGADAIEYLKTLKQMSRPGAPVGVDLILSDLVMAPVNGLLLLRWLRGSPESPDRFLPFLMISGAADQEYVSSARDLGVTEFIAKPFSATSLYKYILEAIDFPRPFIATQNFFGPDRRRQKIGPPKGSERRFATDEDITVVYSADRIKQPKKGNTGIWKFHPGNRLKEKVGGLGSSEGGSIPADIIEKCEEQLERAKVDFTDWAMNYCSELSDLATEALMQPGRRNVYFEKMHTLALELRGQGGTFGYPLISVLGKMLYDTTYEGCREDDNAVEIVKAHVDAIRAVIRERIAGDGGTVGKQLLLSLKQAVKKLEVVN